MFYKLTMLNPSLLASIANQHILCTVPVFVSKWVPHIYMQGHCLAMPH